MLDAATPINLEEQAAEDAQFFRDILHEVINAGVDHIRIGVAHAKARALDHQANPAEDAIAYDRVTRSLRRSIMLAQRVTDPAAAKRRALAHKQFTRGVEDAIHRSTPDKARRETLQAEFQERLERPDLLEELELRPTKQLVAECCRDLALAGPAQPYKRRTPADIDRLNAAAKAAAAPIFPVSFAGRVAHPGATPDSS